MRLVELLVRRMPGIDDPFRLAELGAAVNVIHGPNGSGKTSLARALHGLLWPASLAGKALSLDARFEQEGRTWYARRKGEQVEWSVEGDRCAPPELPDPHLARCFLVTLEDLYDDDRDGLWFAERVLREMAGGYDLAAARKQLFERGPQHGRVEKKRLDEARARVRERELVQEGLSREEAELASLTEELERASEAAGELATLELARQLAAARASLAAAQVRLEALPAAVARLDGKEEERLEALERRLEEQRGKLRELEPRERAARARLAETALAAPLPEEALVEARQRLDELQERERELRALASEGQGARARLEAVGRKLGAAGDPAPLAALDGSELEAVEHLVRDGQLLARERDELSTRLSQLAREDGAGLEPETASTAERLLRAWLRVPAPTASGPAAWGAFLLLVALGIALGLLAGSLLHPAGYALALLVLFLAWLVARPAAASGERERLRADFERGPVAPPVSWTEPEVERRLDELGRELVLARERARAQALRAEHESRARILEERARELELRRNRLRETVGIRTTDSDLALLDLAAALVELRRARGDAATIEGRLESLAREAEEERAALAAFLAAHGEQAGGDATALASALAGLERRSRALREAGAELERIAAERSERSVQLAEDEKERARLFAELSLEPGERAELARLCASRPAFERAREGLLEARGVARELEARLGERMQLADLPEAELSLRLEEARRRAEERERLVARCADIRRGLREAYKGQDLEEARAAEELLRAAFEEAFDDASRAEAGRFLLEEVEREHERLSRPALLERASALFATFTAQRYALDVKQDQGRPGLRAQDRARPGFGLAPEQLSSGTRAQLLLAVRLAFAAEAERGLRLPLVLDDALATSDPDRVRAIGASLLALAREEGRQVLVLTKDEGDVALLREQAGADELRVIDLAALRRTQGAERRRERLAPPPEQRVPAPAGRDGAEYALLLEVEPLDPWRALEGAHLHHLVPDEPQLLHTLLAQGLERVGLLRDALARGLTLGLEPGRRAELAGWTRLAPAVLESWRRGRGRPLSPETLRECPAISDTFQPPLAALAAELGYRAEDLIDALLLRRVKGFREQKAHELRDWLEERGHLPSDRPLERAAAWVRLLGELEALAPDERPPQETLRRRFDYLWQRFEEGASGS